MSEEVSYEVHHHSSQNAGKERAKSFLKKPGVVLLVLILLLAVVLRIYFLSASAGQPLWWDEAEYMAAAKHWAFGFIYDLNPQRPPLFQLFGAFLFAIGLSETAVKVILVLIPSLVLVYLVYLFGKEAFDYKVGLIGAIGTSVVWTYLFWTQRFQPDFFSMCFQMLALYFFWRTMKHKGKLNPILTGVFAALGFYFKISALLIPLMIAVFALWVDGYKAFKKKEYWLILLAYVVVLIPLFIWQYVQFGNPFAFAPSYIGGTDKANRAFGWQTLTYFYIFPKLVFFILMVVGVFMTLAKSVISLDLLFKNREMRLDPGIFSLVVLIISALFYIFYIQGVIEDRWLFIIVPFLFYFSAQAVLFIYKKSAKVSKVLAIIIILVLAGSLIYSQVNFTSALIGQKVNSYQGLKDSGLWLKENSGKDSLILSISNHQTAYYAERHVVSYSWIHNTTRFVQYLDEAHPDYLLISIFEPHPDWVLQRVSLQDGSTALVVPYTNSSLLFSGSGQLISSNFPQESVVDGRTFTLVYPTNQFNGVFVYKIGYDSTF